MDIFWDNSIPNRHNLRNFIALGGENKSLIKVSSYVMSKNKNKLVRDYCVILFDLLVHTHYLDPLLYDKLILKMNNTQAKHKYKNYFEKEITDNYFKKVITLKTQEYKKTLKIDPMKVISLKEIDESTMKIIKDEVDEIKSNIKQVGYRYKENYKEALDSLVINLEDFVTLPVVRYGAVNSTENELISTIDYIFENYTKTKIQTELAQYEPQIRDLIYLLNRTEKELDNNNVKKMQHIESYIRETFI